MATGPLCGWDYSREAIFFFKNFIAKGGRLNRGRLLFEEIPCMPHSHQIDMFNKTRFSKKETQKTGQENQLLHRIQISELQHVPVKSISGFYEQNNFELCFTKHFLNMNKFWCEWRWSISWSINCYNYFSFKQRHKPKLRSRSDKTWLRRERVLLNFRHCWAKLVAITIVISVRSLQTM